MDKKIIFESDNTEEEKKQFEEFKEVHPELNIIGRIIEIKEKTVDLSETIEDNSEQLKDIVDNRKLVSHINSALKDFFQSYLFEVNNEAVRTSIKNSINYYLDSLNDKELIHRDSSVNVRQETWEDLYPNNKFKKQMAKFANFIKMPLTLKKRTWYSWIFPYEEEVVCTLTAKQLSDAYFEFIKETQDFDCDYMDEEDIKSYYSEENWDSINIPIIPEMDWLYVLKTPRSNMVFADVVIHPVKIPQQINLNFIIE